MQLGRISLQSRQPPAWRISRSNLDNTATHALPVRQSVDSRGYQHIPLRKNIPRRVSHILPSDRQSQAYRSSDHSQWIRNASNQQSPSPIISESPTLRDNFGSLFYKQNDSDKTRNRQKKNRLRKAFLLICGCLVLPFLLALLLALLFGFLYHPQSSKTTISVTFTTTTPTTSTTSTTTSTTTVTTTTTSASTTTTTVTQTTTTSTSTATTTSTTITTSTTSKFFFRFKYCVISLRQGTTTTTTSSSTTTTTTITTTTTMTTTTAFNCASNITSTLDSYSKHDCAKDTWHTFSNSFVASYNGIRTLVFSCTSISDANVYLTNIKINDASNVQLLNNGDFSASSGSTPTNWLKCSDYGLVDSTCNVATSSACYTISAAGGFISQSFSVVSGTNYTIQFDLYHDSGHGNSGDFNLNVAAV
ncbi:unnamed protein product [Adineta steineri]|uniref:Uncharacterized protein n=1 Tax=Adineta steineri TaxID=433720 RepID=A0A815C6U6_9BILA|nr:unnamed protein product [Adineta steineri]CAF1282171.1 unnamed protein product [Adineta steineri]CAF1340008.1 unnamed protein product [Adineta steineri]CAF3621516.1 unnamed protein product [Adineta steineri]CAF3968409.1 unnamed protein product [Adineta steineri]